MMDFTTDANAQALSIRVGDAIANGDDFTFAVLIRGAMQSVADEQGDSDPIDFTEDELESIAIRYSDSIANDEDDDENTPAAKMAGAIQSVIDERGEDGDDLAASFPDDEE